MFKNTGFKNIKNNSNHQALALLDFSYAEYSSGIEMLQAAKLSKNSKLARGFIDHSLDEFKHTAFFLNCLKTTLNSQNLELHYKFDTKNLYYLGFLSEKKFLFEKFDLYKFATFVGVNEKQALLLFKKIRESNFLKEISDLKKLDQIIEEEKKHLNETKSDDFFHDYDQLITDEVKHVKHATEFSKKYFNNFKRQYWNCGFWLANKFRHFLAKNKFLNNLFNILISYLIIILCIPFKSALKIKKRLGDNIDFSIEKSRLIL